ncbi:MAG: hypothetical protein H7Y38_07995 [Armatimonadetes bacterium]|nr:hypothetical protein [Armatimonadota bacterium]
MLDRFRLPLLLVSAVLMIWGATLFWNGKTTTDAERKNRKPLSLTRDALLTNPPKTAITWVKITDGNAPLSRALRLRRGTNPDAPTFLYVPLVSPKEAERSLDLRQLAQEKPNYLVMIRATDKKRVALYNALKPLESSSVRTTDTWLSQNRDAVTLRPPFTGLLVRRGFDPLAKVVAAPPGFAPDGYILWENEEPLMVATAPVATGLALLMGVPTLWIFALLITGKFDPPDDDPVGASTPTEASGRVNIPAPSGSVMPSAPPDF